jgi:tocopherol O-methyltransferase
MIDGPPLDKAAIRRHYDLFTPLYRLIWGPHVHHGLWADGVATPPMRAAQERLIDLLAEQAAVRPGQQVLDVGCGMGGSSLALARRYRCRVLGVTLSPVQRSWAATVARMQGLSPLVRFVRADAELLRLPPASVDVVWVIECSEHLFDKPGFFRKAAGWLRPGGRVALCAWLAGDGPKAAEVARSVCEGFLCPSLGTAGDYQDWLAAAGLEPITFVDLTPRVAATWEVCRRRLAHSGLPRLRWLFGRADRRFADSFTTLLDGYRSGAMRYGLFVSRRSCGPESARGGQVVL